MKNYGKIFKWLLVALLIISVALLVWGVAVGFEANDGKAVDVLFYWAYFMVGLALAAVILVGLVIGVQNNPKSIIKLLIGVVAIAAVCAIVYAISAGSPAMGMLEQPSASTLKLTDTILNLTYLTAGLAVIAIIVGEIVMAVRNKK